MMSESEHRRAFDHIWVPSKQLGNCSSKYKRYLGLLTTILRADDFMTKNGCKEEQGTKDAIQGSSLLGWNVAPFPSKKKQKTNDGFPGGFGGGRWE